MKLSHKPSENNTKKWIKGPNHDKYVAINQERSQERIKKWEEQRKQKESEEPKKRYMYSVLREQTLERAIKNMMHCESYKLGNYGSGIFFRLDEFQTASAPFIFLFDGTKPIMSSTTFRRYMKNIAAVYKSKSEMEDILRANGLEVFQGKEMLCYYHRSKRALFLVFREDFKGISTIDALEAKFETLKKHSKKHVQTSGVSLMNRDKSLSVHLEKKALNKHFDWSQSANVTYETSAHRFMQKLNRMPILYPRDIPAEKRLDKAAMDYLFSNKSLALPHLAYPEALCDCAEHLLKLWEDCGLPMVDYLNYGTVKLMYDQYHNYFNKSDESLCWYFKALNRLTESLRESDKFTSYNLFWVFLDKTIKEVEKAVEEGRERLFNYVKTTSVQNKPTYEIYEAFYTTFDDEIIENKMSDEEFIERLKNPSIP